MLSVVHTPFFFVTMEVYTHSCSISVPPASLLSGDVARMLSDHPDLTLAALTKTHLEDPQQFGLALGNMRYLLAEVLKGLAYIYAHAACSCS